MEPVKTMDVRSRLRLDEIGSTLEVRPQVEGSNWREFDLNPVLVKELRQAVRNRFVLGGINTLLLLLVAAALFYLVKTDSALTQSERVGESMFAVFFGILTVAAILVVPVYIAAQLAIERYDQSFELMQITPLGGHRILRGKIYAGLCLAALAFSLCIPFMAFTTFMGGVDFPSVLFALFWTSLAVAMALQSAMLVACIICRWFLKCLLGVLLFGGLLLLSIAMIVFAQPMLRLGITSKFDRYDFWLGCGMAFLLALCALASLHIISIALLVRNTRRRGYYNELIRTQPVEPV